MQPHDGPRSSAAAPVCSEDAHRLAATGRWPAGNGRQSSPHHHQRHVTLVHQDVQRWCGGPSLHRVLKMTRFNVCALLRSLALTALSPTTGRTRRSDCRPSLDLSVHRRLRVLSRFDGCLSHSLYEEADWRLRTAMVLCHETGHRIGAVSKLQWENVDLTRALVTWAAAHDKTELEHTTPLTEAAIDALHEAYKLGHPSRWVMHVLRSARRLRSRSRRGP